MSSTRSSAKEHEELDFMTVIKPVLGAYYGRSIGLALFERDPLSSGWSKNISLNSMEWNSVWAKLNGDSKFGELCKMVPEKPKTFISSHMVLECDFCAKVYATASSKTKLQTNNKDSPPVLPPSFAERASSQNDQFGGASSEPSVHKGKYEEAKKTESSAGERSSDSMTRERRSEDVDNAARVEAALIARKQSLPSLAVPIENEMVALFELGVGQTCNPYYKLLQLEVCLQAYQLRRWFARRNEHSVDVCGLVLNTQSVEQIEKLFREEVAPALSQKMYNEGRLLLLGTETVGQLAHKSYAGLTQLENRMSSLEQTVTSQLAAQDARMSSLEQTVTSQFAAQDARITALLAAQHDALIRSLAARSSPPDAPPPPRGARSTRRPASRPTPYPTTCSECHETCVLSNRNSNDGLKYCRECWRRYDDAMQ